MKARRLIKVKKGLNIPLKGEPSNELEEKVSARYVAVAPQDIPGIKVRMLVEEGDIVSRGQPIFEHRKVPGIVFTSPAHGKVVAVKRGERRALLSVDIELSEEEKKGVENVPEIEWKASDDNEENIKRSLQLSGLWTNFRTRPLGKVPESDSRPKAIFVNIMKKFIHSPDSEFLLNTYKKEFNKGLEVLSKFLKNDKLYICGEKEEVELSEEVEKLSNIEYYAFTPLYPATLSGFHVHSIYPCSRERVSWTLDLQAVIDIGYLFLYQKMNVFKIITIAGPQASNPHHWKVRKGALINDLVQKEMKEGETRIISGSVFQGISVESPEGQFLNTSHYEISLLKEDRDRIFLGWLHPRIKEIKKIFFANKEDTIDLTTNRRGELRPIVAIGRYEKYFPFDINPTYLFKAILSGNIELAEELGVIELVEEDVSLCSFVCPSKIAFGEHLRTMLDIIEKEG